MQLDLFEAIKTPTPTDSLFLAVFPDHSTTLRIVELAANLSERYGLKGKLRPLDHLHVTLHWLGDYVGVPETVVHAVGQACTATTARVPAFEASFDRAASFKGRPGNHPLVMLGNEEADTAFMKFHHMLLTELARAGCLEKKNLKFKPHITLLYDKQSLIEEPIDPINFTVGEIVLVRSEVGATKYHRLAQWPLQA